MKDDDCMCLVCPSSTADSTDDAEPPDSGCSTGKARRTRGFSVRIHGKVHLHSADLINSTVSVLTGVQCMIVCPSCSLPRVVKRRVNALKNLQVKCAHIEAKFYEEVHELERKYAALYQPLYDKVSTFTQLYHFNMLSQGSLHPR